MLVADDKEAHAVARFLGMLAPLSRRSVILETELTAGRSLQPQRVRASSCEQTPTGELRCSPVNRLSCAWLVRLLAEQGEPVPATRLARQIVLLMDGSFAIVLLHRDPSYMETAGEAAFALVSAALKGAGR